MKARRLFQAKAAVTPLTTLLRVKDQSTVHAKTNGTDQTPQHPLLHTDQSFKQFSNICLLLLLLNGRVCPKERLLVFQEKQSNHTFYNKGSVSLAYKAVAFSMWLFLCYILLSLPFQTLETKKEVAIQNSLRVENVQLRQMQSVRPDVTVYIELHVCQSVQTEVATRQLKQQCFIANRSQQISKYITLH